MESVRGSVCSGAVRLVEGDDLGCVGLFCRQATASVLSSATATLGTVK